MKEEESGAWVYFPQLDPQTSIMFLPIAQKKSLPLAHTEAGKADTGI